MISAKFIKLHYTHLFLFFYFLFNKNFIKATKNHDTTKRKSLKPYLSTDLLVIITLILLLYVFIVIRLYFSLILAAYSTLIIPFLLILVTLVYLHNTSYCTEYISLCFLVHLHTLNLCIRSQSLYTYCQHSQHSCVYLNYYTILPMIKPIYVLACGCIISTLHLCVSGIRLILRTPTLGLFGQRNLENCCVRKFGIPQIENLKCSKNQLTWHQKFPPT